MRSYIAFIITIAAASVAWSAETDKPLSGDVRLLSHHVEHGISQSDHSPAIQGDFWFNLGPQFRLGVAGSSVNYKRSDEHFNLLLNADLKVDLAANSDLRLSYSKSQYYESGDRNGVILGIKFKYEDYRAVHSSYTNWEGTLHPSARYGVGKSTSVFSSWILDLEGAYNMPSDENFEHYVDGRIGMGRQLGPVFVEGSITGTSAGSQFEHGEGDVFFIPSAMKEL